MREVSSLRRDDVVRLRAGAVVGNGSAVLLPSVYQPELPALVGLLVRDGLAYLSDELVHLDPVLRTISGPGLPLLIDPRDLALFPGIDREVAATRRAERKGELRFAVSAAELGGSRGQAAAVSRIAFPSFEPGGPTAVEAISRSEAAFGLARATLNLHVWGQRALVLANELLRGADVARLRVGSLRKGADVLRSWLEE